jgi:hypothetical protein
MSRRKTKSKDAKHETKAAIIILSDPKGGGLALLKHEAVAGTPGISNLRNYLVGGWRTLIF